eukprot:4922043-Prorocentrum_lima.AAC.1
MGHAPPGLAVLLPASEGALVLLDGSVGPTPSGEGADKEETAVPERVERRTSRRSRRWGAFYF